MTFFAGFDFKAQVVSSSQHEAGLQPSTPSSRYAASWAPLPRHSVHRWTIEEQAILCAMDRWLISEMPVGQRLLSYRDMRRTFCAYFADTIRFQGEPREMTNDSIAAQLYEIKKEREYNVAWREVFLNTDFSDPLNEWAATREELIATASLIGIVLLRRPFEDKAKVFEVMSTGRKRKRVHHSRPWTNDEKSARIHGVGTSHGLLTPETPERAQLNHTDISPLARKGGSPSGPIALPQLRQLTAPSDNAARDSGNLPLSQLITPNPELSPRKERVKRTKRGIRRINDRNDILFRYWDSNSQGVNTREGFLAGAYMDKDMDCFLPIVPSLLSEEYLGPAEPHLLRKHVATPLISVYDSFLPALHRALRSESNNVSIGIIDAHVLDKDRDSEHPRAVWARNTAQELKSRGRYHLEYEGETEWLVWARIRKEAMVSTVSIDSLRKYIQRHPELEDLFRFEGIQKARNWYEYSSLLKANAAKIDFSVGQTVGDLLAFFGIPRKYMRATASKLARVWRLQRMTDPKKKEEYLNGVYHGFSIRQSPDSDATEEYSATSHEIKEPSSDEYTMDEFAARREHIKRVLRGYSPGVIEISDDDVDW